MLDINSITHRTLYALIMKSDNNKPSPISKINKAKFTFKAEQHGLLKDRGGIRCLGGVKISCQPVAPAVC